MKSHQFMKHLRIAVLLSYEINKLDEIKISKEKSFWVYDGYVIKLLSEILKFSYLIVPTPAIGESQPDGNWTGCIGMVQKEIADIAICAAAITDERSQVVSFSHPYIYSALTFATDKPQPLPNSYAIIYAFSWQVWIALAISFVFMLLIIYKLFSSKQTLFTILTRMLGTLAEQSFNIQSRSSYVRLTIIFWIIGAMFITYSYKAVLLASFSFPNYSGIFNMKDLAKAAEDPSFQCGVTRGSVTYKVLVQFHEEHVSNCIIRTPPPDRFDYFLNNSSYKKAAFSGKNYLKRFKRDFFISADEFFPGGIGIIVNKNFCCLELFNDVILRISEAGIIQKYQDDIEFFHAISSKATNDNNYSSNQILKLLDLYGAFKFLILGLLFSTLVLVIEIIIHKYKKN